MCFSNVVWLGIVPWQSWHTIFLGGFVSDLLTGGVIAPSGGILSGLSGLAGILCLFLICDLSIASLGRFFLHMWH